MAAGLVIENQARGRLSNLTTGVTPSYWETKQAADYTVEFAPVNFEQRMQILITVPDTITIPDEIICHGKSGLDDPLVQCDVDQEKNTIRIANGLDKRDLAPPLIEVMIESLYNPKEHINTESFHIETFTHDDYGIDYIYEDVTVNFFCVTPCKTCNLTEPTQCFSCYTAASSSATFLHEDTCLDSCPNTMYAVMDPDPRIEDEAPTCEPCEWPCVECSYHPNICNTCAAGYELYEVNRTCFETGSTPAIERKGAEEKKLKIQD
jgi:hypothetical protein